MVLRPLVLGAFANCEKRLLTSLCPPVRMEQLGTHRTEFHEILHMTVFRKSDEKIKGSLKSDKDNGHLTSRPMYTNDNISLNSS